MAEDPNRPVVLTTVPTEVQAALIVAALCEQGIEAQTIGELTSAFRAEVPGGVSILVRQADLNRARVVLQTAQPGQRSGS
jgi:hypothetical protein